MIVKPIKNQDAWSWCIDVHYAKRVPSITYAFGMFDPDLIGVVTYGTPSSSPLRAGVCGADYADKVLELNRLVFVDTPKNGASMLVGQSIRQLPESVIVSYADTNQGHVGYVYQACNFIYTGLSAKRTDWKVEGLEHLHGQTIADQSRGAENRVQWMRDKYGDDFYLEDRPRKHRYVYLNGSKSFKKKARKALQYPVCDYPKGDTSRYKITGKPQIQGVMF